MTRRRPPARRPIVGSEPSPVDHSSMLRKQNGDAMPAHIIRQ